MPYEEYSTTVDQRSFTVTTSSIEIAGPAEAREAVMISAPPADRITIVFGRDAVDQEGQVIFAGDPPLILYRKFLGKAVTLPIFAIASAGSHAIGVTQFLRS